MRAVCICTRGEGDSILILLTSGQGLSCETCKGSLFPIKPTLIHIVNVLKLVILCNKPDFSHRIACQSWLGGGLALNPTTFDIVPFLEFLKPTTTERGITVGKLVLYPAPNLMGSCRQLGVRCVRFLILHPSMPFIKQLLQYWQLSRPPTASIARYCSLIKHGIVCRNNFSKRCQGKSLAVRFKIPIVQLPVGPLASPGLPLLSNSQAPLVGHFAVHTYLES